MYFRLFLIVILGFYLLSGCSKGYREYRKDNTIVIAVTSEPKRLNPIFLTDFVSYSISGLTFNGLTKFDKDMNVVGDLAESWDILNGGREIIFHLKKGILWHDGVELTSDDIVFTYKTLISPMTESPLSSQLGPIKDVRSINKYKVSITYFEPYGSALESLMIGIVPKHVLQDKDINKTFFDDSPIGTGPYKLKEWIHGRRLSLEAFDNYHGGCPNIKNLIISIIPDTSTQLLELESGNIDLMEISPLLFNRGLSSDFVKYRAGSFRYGFFGLNLEDKRFKDKRVRQAISYSIDKDSIIKSVLSGLGSRSTGPYPPEAWYYSTEARYYEYNPDKAIDLLSQAGWRKGNDGILRKDGDIMSFTILTNYESKENIKIAQIIQSSLKTVGIKTNILTLEWQTFRHNVISNHQFEAIVLSRAYLWDPDIFELWHSSKTKKGEWNFLSYKNKEVDRLLEKGRKSINISERRKIYKKLHELLAEDVPCIFLYNSDLIFTAHKRIKGIIPTPAGMFYGIEKWSIN